MRIWSLYEGRIPSLLQMAIFVMSDVLDLAKWSVRALGVYPKSIFRNPQHFLLRELT
jgi:hypothetical protein